MDKTCMMQIIKNKIILISGKSRLKRSEYIALYIHTRKTCNVAL